MGRPIGSSDQLIPGEGDVKFIFRAGHGDIHQTSLLLGIRALGVGDDTVLAPEDPYFRVFEPFGAVHGEERDSFVLGRQGAREDLEALEKTPRHTEQGLSGRVDDFPGTRFSGL